MSRVVSPHFSVSDIDFTKCHKCRAVQITNGTGVGVCHGDGEFWVFPIENLVTGS